MSRELIVLMFFRLVVLVVCFSSSLFRMNWCCVCEYWFFDEVSVWIVVSMLRMVLVLMLKFVCVVLSVFWLVFIVDFVVLTWLMLVIIEW